MMTAIAFILGVIPMMTAHGAGAASRVSLGTAVVFGMLINAVFGTLFVPGFWAALQDFRRNISTNCLRMSTPCPRPDGR